MKENNEIIKLENIDNNELTQIEDLVQKNKELQNKLDESENRYKYLLADLDNIRKRNLKILQDKEKYEGENIIKEIIDLLDYLDYIIDNNDISKCDNIIDVKQKLLNILSNYDVKLIYEERPALFNDQYDNAVSQVKVDNKTLDNSIYAVVKKGYMFKDKVIRYESVIINKYE